MRVVLDTNVFVSSFFGGNPGEIIKLWRSGRIYLCLSAAILDEYVEVLARLGIAGEKELEELLALFRRGFNIIFIHNPPGVSVVDQDPDDDKFFACAAAMEADAVVSGDRKVLEIKKFMGITVYSPAEFLKLFH
ncbi:MAG: putative toxin-antitoxin system toxin component, PIN family [Desulfobacterales bacterium]